MVKKVDVKREMDELFAHCSDVVVYFGTFEGPAKGGTDRLAMVRVVVEEELPMRDWPKELIYRRAIEYPSEMSIICVCPPGDFLNPWATVEWDDVHQQFLDAAEKHKVFFFEIWSPVKKRVAIYADGKLLDSRETDISPELYADVAGGRMNRSPGPVRAQN